MKNIKHYLTLLKKPSARRMMIALAIALLMIGGYYFFQKTQNRVSVENSQVLAPIANISPSTSGKLLETDVYEGENVKKGDLLAVVGTETLRADNDGLIIMANRAIGSLVGPQAPIIQMIDLSQMRVDGTIDEDKGLNQIKIGQAVSFTVDALPGKTFWGYVDEISPTAKQTQLSFSISSTRPIQQFDIFARFNAADLSEIKNGMSAKMTVYTNSL